MMEENEKRDWIKFIKRIILFSIIAVICFLIVNSIYTNNILIKKGAFRAENVFIENKDNISILFIGDSHPANAINSDFIPNSFNYAVGGEKYSQNFFKLRNALKQTDNIKVIVMTVDLNSLTDQEESNSFDCCIWYWKKFMTFKEIESLAKISKFDTYIVGYLPLISSGDYIGSYLLDSLNKKIKTEYNSTKQEINFTSSAEYEVRVQFSNYTSELNTIQYKYFLKSFNLAKEKNKTIILINYPVTKEYIAEAENGGVNFSQYNNLIKELIENNEEVYLLEYSNFTEEIKLYKDADHLNNEGAEIFSKQLYEDLIDNKIVNEK
ncbi:hypothetical protein J4403_04580 [Candidatus Woesearchaeota archaeon]|nr:hypothetical protein [Candidatus Woesearchaeota archaeon]